MTKYFVTAIGNSIIDVLTFVEDSFLTNNSLEKGSMILIDQSHASVLTNLKYDKICSGGSAANIVVAMGNFGIKNAFIGKVGCGNYGDIFHNNLIENNVDFYCKNKSSFGSTARSFVLITPDKERTMCTYLGESSNISDEIDDNVIINSEILLLEGYLWDKKPVIEALQKAITVAKNNKVKIAFTLCDSFFVENHKADFLKITAIAHIVFANEKEIKALISSDKIDYEKIKELGKVNKDLTLIITRSEKGALIFSAKNQEFIEVPAIKIDNMRDDTGAGDCFAAGFLYGLSKKLPLKESAQIGNLFASNVIQNIGAKLEKEQIENIKETLELPNSQKN